MQKTTTISRLNLIRLAFAALCGFGVLAGAVSLARADCVKNVASNDVLWVRVQPNPRAPSAWIVARGDFSANARRRTPPQSRRDARDDQPNYLRPRLDEDRPTARELYGAHQDQAHSRVGTGRDAARRLRA